MRKVAKTMFNSFQTSRLHNEYFISVKLGNATNLRKTLRRSCKKESVRIADGGCSSESSWQRTALLNVCRFSVWSSSACEKNFALMHNDDATDLACNMQASFL